MSIRKLTALAIIALVSGSTFAASKPRTVTVAVSVPGQASIAANDVTLNVAGKPAVISAAPAVTNLVVPDIKLDQFTTELPEAIKNPIIFVFDSMDTKEIEDRDMRKAALKFMADAAAKKQAVGLVVIDRDHFTVIHDYRSGSAVLAAALARASGTAADAPAGAEAKVGQEAKRLTEFARGDWSTKVADDYILRTTLEVPIYMMQDIAAGLRDIPGRKALVWVTASAPFEIEDRDHSLTTHLELNNGAGVSTSVIASPSNLGSTAGTTVQSSKRLATDDQIKKLQPLWRSALFNLWESGTAVYTVEARSNFSPPAGRVYTATMTSIAEMTGGRAFYGSHDPLPFLNSITVENASSTRVAFSIDAPNDGWQKLSASSPKGTPLAPSGMFPPPDFSPDDARKKAISVALNSRFGYAGMPFRLTLGEQAPNAGKTTVKFAVFLLPNAGFVDEKTGEINLDIAAVALGKKDEKAGTMGAAVATKVPTEAIKQIGEMGSNLSQKIDVPSGQYLLRVIVRDNLTGRIGSIEAPLDVK